MKIYSAEGACFCFTFLEFRFRVICGVILAEFASSTRLNNAASRSFSDALLKDEGARLIDMPSNASCKAWRSSLLSCPSCSGVGTLPTQAFPTCLNPSGQALVAGTVSTRTHSSSSSVKPAYLHRRSGACTRVLKHWFLLGWRSPIPEHEV
eukprot:Blabericola_migrator_1__4230@NODE_229_length_11083_cov_77_301198_g195_i0_p8_GENE_NODE_229_length_11083_cov_77_301198_g195_i0NODE_229_length_11083_cov_77_301198_g195_i0_p8_ORF_typecomplete_len151_score13_40AntiTRAP/PF15777_5/0_089_NODE_229_length_11083_cov_77_301198_g195_i051385590